jgi:hypothetical protein
VRIVVCGVNDDREKMDPTTKDLEPTWQNV